VKKEYLPTVFVMLMGVTIFIASLGLESSMYQPLGAACYSRIIIGLLLLCGIGSLWSTRRKLAASKESVETKKTAGDGSRLKMSLFVVLVVLYGLGFMWLGFFSSSFLFISLSVFLLSGQRPIDLGRGVATAVVVVGLVYVCFKYFLNLYFPEVWLF